MPTIKESFVIDFDGTAFDKHEISASSVAQSLLALDALLQSVSKQLYGKQAVAEVKIKSGSHLGSFFVYLSIEYSDEDPTKTGAAPVLKNISVVEVLKDLIRLNKFVLGKSAKPKDQRPEEIRITVGVEKSLNADAALSLQKDCALKDKTSEVLLTVISPMLNGDRTGWRFSEGNGSSEFAADVEDEDFLQTVRTGKLSWTTGTSLLTSMRALQVKTNDGFNAKRTVLQVKKVIQPLSSELIK
ncbi:MAG: hypothetical protein KH225_04685 [Proteobacteria bacterium]|jgi:hypothetical protein|uniref:hypothetical protein n=1 Tax=Parasutterella sp. TaxID=2049037 RepID=UPI0039A23888|nr:hypothetical protein [Pseudomonadota bacterium]